MRSIHYFFYFIWYVKSEGIKPTHYCGASVKITRVSIGIEKTVWQTGKGNDPLFEENSHCLHVNLIVGHLKLLLC